jgi:lysozyme
MDLARLKKQIEAFEGRAYRAYPDPLTGGIPWTIGVGHCGPEVHKGLAWSDAEIDAAFDLDVNLAITECERKFPWFFSLTDPRQAVIIGMCFQMGMTRLLGFTRMLRSVADEHYANAAEEMRQSVWAHQTPKRVIRLAFQLESGNWQ